MKRYFYFLTLVLLISCEEEEIIPLPLFEPVGTWENSIFYFEGIQETYITSGIINGHMMWSGTYLTIVTEEDGEQTNFINNVRQSSYYRNFYSPRFLYRKDFRDPSLFIVTETMYNQYGYYLNASDVGSQYVDFNFEHHMGAANSDDIAIVSLATETPQSQIHLALFKTVINQSEFAERDTNFGFIQLTLPTENSIAVHRMESDGTHFYVSITENSYRITSDGSYQKIFNFPVRDYFEYLGNWYADTGEAIYISKDKGNNWQLVVDNLNYSGAREFFKAGENLFFFDEDKVYHVMDIATFDYQQLENRTLKDRKITSAIEWQGKLYLTTLKGVFSKPLNRLFEGLN